MLNSRKMLKKVVDRDTHLVEKDPEFKDLFQAVLDSQKRYAKVIRTEDAMKDFTWLDIIEDKISHIAKIIDNPRSFIKPDNYVVKAELAKRTGPESVQHLAMHSQFVKKVDDDGNIIPSKILMTSSDEDLAIYENRFVMTLIKRLHLYIEKRYAFVKKFFDLISSNVTYVDNDIEMGNMKITVSSMVKIDTPSMTIPEMEAKTIIERIEYLRKMVNYFVNSGFMKSLKNARPVQSPIMQTNIIRKNPEYKACFELWLFLGEQEKVNMNFIVNEEVKRADKTATRYLNHIVTLQVLEAMDVQNLKTMRYTSKKHEIRPLKTIDEKLFLNDKFKNFEFVRVDEQYYDDLITRREARMGTASERVRKLVFKDEMEDIKDYEKGKRAIQKLAQRIEKESAKEDIAIANQEEENQRILDAMKKQEEEEDYAQKQKELEELRKEVIAYANGEVEEAEEAKKEEEENDDGRD